MISDKSAGESLSNKFVSINFFTTKGDPAWTQHLSEAVAKVALSRNDAKKASLHFRNIMLCPFIYYHIFIISQITFKTPNRTGSAKFYLIPEALASPDYLVVKTNGFQSFLVVCFFKNQNKWESRQKIFK